VLSYFEVILCDEGDVRRGYMTVEAPGIRTYGMISVTGNGVSRIETHYQMYPRCIEQTRVF
jgi:hypothetical protein